VINGCTLLLNTGEDMTKAWRERVENEKREMEAKHMTQEDILEDMFPDIKKDRTPEEMKEDSYKAHREAAYMACCSEFKSAPKTDGCKGCYCENNCIDYEEDEKNTKCTEIIKHTLSMSEEEFNKMYDRQYQESERENSSGLF
jgi:hypothetical protein